MKRAEPKANRTCLRVENFNPPLLPESVRVNGKRRRPAAKAPPSDETLTLQPVTQVEARIDVGWGNALFIRGEGLGLSWDRGTPMACVDGSTWVWITTGAADRLRFKLLINDQLWAGGDDLGVEPGARIEVSPAFPSWPR